MNKEKKRLNDSFHRYVMINLTTRYSKRLNDNHTNIIFKLTDIIQYNM